MVLRNFVTTRHFCEIRIRSCTRQILDTAATISGVRPGARAASDASVAASESSQSRKPPTRQMRDDTERLRIVIVDDEARHLVGFVRHDVLGEEHRQRHVGERHLSRHPLLVVTRRHTREIVPDRAGVAFAISTLKVSKM